MTKTLKMLVLTASALALAAPANATLLLRGGFANAALTVDGWGDGGDADGLQANVPAGSTVVAAYLYSADVFGNSPNFGTFTFGGSSFTWGDGTLLTPNANGANTRLFNVTSIVKPVIDGGAGGIYNFSVSESAFLDGEVLVVVYRNASTMGSTAILLDGELSQGGDTTLLSFAAPYAGGDAFMSLASSFSFNGSGDSGNSQFTTVDVRTSSNPAARRLSNCASGNDDANFLAANGSLITAGGVGDNPANPSPTCEGGGGDDEFYNLALGNSADSDPFLSVGDTFIEFLTTNPSFDDNVFGLFFSTTFAIDRVDDDPIDPIDTPEPGMLGLLGMGLAGLALRRRRRA